MFLPFAKTTRRLASFAAASALALSFAGAAAAVDFGNPVPIRLEPSVTVVDEVVRLSDLFSGDLNSADKVVGPSPAPGQRVVLPSEWLAALARTNGIDSHPTSTYDRSMVIRPGQTIPADEILAAVKAELIVHGMPSGFNLKPFSVLSPVTIATNAPRTIDVREPAFDAATKSFSAVAEIAAGGSSAQFVMVRGSGFATVSVPTLKQRISRDTIITADLVENIIVAEKDVPDDAVMSADELIGKAPRGFIKSGQAIRQSEVHQITLTKIPVLRTERRRGEEIDAKDLIWVEIDSEDVANGVVIDAEELIGKSPLHYIAGGMPVRKSDIQSFAAEDIPVAARDIQRGTTLADSDITWVRLPESGIVGSVARTKADLIGLIANSNVRAGQTFRTISILRPVTIPKGKLITVIYSTRAMNLTAKGKILQDGSIGEVIRVTNTKSNQTVFAEVIDAETVRVTDQQTAMN